MRSFMQKITKHQGRKRWQVKALTWGLYGTYAAWVSVFFSRGRSRRSKMLGNRSTGEEGRSWTEGMEQWCQVSVLDWRWQKRWGYRLKNTHYRRLEKGMEVQLCKSCCCSLPWSAPSKQTVGHSTPDDWWGAKQRAAELSVCSAKEFSNTLSSITIDSLRLLWAVSSREGKQSDNTF